MRLGILGSHPIQYQAPWFRALAEEVRLQVFFAHRPSSDEQGSGFGKAFKWDIDLLDGYPHRFLTNVSRNPGVNHFGGCDTPEIACIIRDGRFDAFVVNGWQLKAYWQAVRACRRARVPILVRGDSQLRSPRSLAKRLVKPIAYRFLLRLFSGFLVVGERNREYLASYGVSSERMFPAPHFVDNDWFRTRAAEARGNRARQRAEWGVGEDVLVALFVGKFISKKRPQDLIHALAHLQRRGNNSIGVFVGAGELEHALHQESKRLNVTVRFEGFRNQTELPRYYALADVLVLPSDGGETWGLVVNEAMACGLPAVVSDAVGCAPDLIDQGKTGFVFPVADSGSLAQRMESLLDLKLRGHDFRPALEEKMKAYSVEAAVSGTLKAIHALAPGV